MLTSPALSTQIIPNTAQEECIKSLIGPVIVLAGPGTGKTTTIIKRIEYMLNSGIAPERVLALTFSEAAANEMKVRLLNLIGPKASSVTIHTYHAFCSDLISQNTLKFEVVEDFNVIDDLNKYRLMREVITDLRPKQLITKNNDPYFYVSYILGAIRDIKLNRITRDKYFRVLEADENWKPLLITKLKEKELQEALEKEGKRNRLKTLNNEIETLDKQIKKAEELWEFYEKYCQKMSCNGFIDFDDMINLVLEAFEKDSSFLEIVRSNFDYFLVDEYQDTNPSQNDLIFKLASDNANANLFVVGDDDQIIYSFQGAQINNIENFLSIYPSAKVICLNENNRSTQKILNFIYNIISQDESRLENNEKYKVYNISKRLISSGRALNLTDKNAELHILGDEKQSNNFIIEAVQRVIDENPTIKLSNIAILTRTNAELDIFGDQLRAKNVPFQVSRQKDIFSLKPSMLVYLYLKALENPALYSQSLFGILCHPPFDFAVEDYNFIIEENSRTHHDFLTIIKEHLEKFSWKNKQKVLKFYTDFENHRSLLNDDKLSNIVVRIINETGILQYYASHTNNKFDNISSLRKLIDEVRNFEKLTRPATLPMLMTYMDSAIQENILLEIDSDGCIENAVQLLTVHKAKGREFDYVFISNLSSKNWEKRRTIDHLKIPVEKPEFSKDSEAARLLYVACSRARYNLTLVHPNTVNSKNLELSKLVSKASELDADLITVNHEYNTEDLVKELIKHYTDVSIYNHSEFIEKLKTRASLHVLSPTSLNDYNSCPKKFLYKHIYRIPELEPINKFFSLGNAVHRALEKFVKGAKTNNNYSSRDNLIKYFDQALDKQLFPSMQDRELSRQNGIRILNNYFSRLVSTPIPNIVGVEVNLNFIPIAEYFIKGKVDRIDIDSEGNYIVIDYKTGSPKSKKDIFEEDGKYRGYLDQLRFYKKCIEIKSPNIKVSQGIISFINEPDKSVYANLTEDDSNIIEQKIIKAIESIRKVEFDPVDQETQKAEACEKCQFKLLCRLKSI